MRKFFKSDLFKILCAFIFSVLWSILMLLFFSWLHDTSVKSVYLYTDIWRLDIFSIVDNYKAEFFYSCLAAPFIEELLFRVFPARLTGLLPEYKQGDILIPFILFSSIVFGLMHRGGGEIHVFFQGVMGLVNFMIYYGTKRKYLSCVSVHFLWNFYCLSLYPIIINYFF